jgi:hypothetical protein
MSYGHYQFEKNLTTSGLTMATSGVIGLKIAPTYQPIVVRAFGCMNTSTLASGNAMVATLTNRTLTATTATVVATVNGNPAKGAGKYVTGLSKKCSPGEELAFHLTTAASGAVLLHWTVFVEPQWEEPGNISAITVST